VNGHETEKDFIAQALKNTYWLRDAIRNAINVEEPTPLLAVKGYVQDPPLARE